MMQDSCMGEVAPEPGRRTGSEVAGRGWLGFLVFLGIGATVLVGLFAGLVFARLIAGVAVWQKGFYLSGGQWFDVTRNAVAVVGLFGIGGAAVVAYRRQRTSEDTQRTQAAAQQTAADALVVSNSQYRLESKRHDLELANRKDDAITRLRGRYTAAAEQLGHSSPVVRIAGVQALAALADDWHLADVDVQRQVCIDVLCAYLRLDYIPHDPDNSRSAPPGEQQVRWTVMSVIRNHLLKAPPAQDTWCGRDFDFTGASFDGGSFAGARFSGGTVNFSGAKFMAAGVNFAETKFSGGVVNFTRAQFLEGAVSFTGAKFVGGTVTFIQSEISGGRLLFHGAEFDPGSTVSFTVAKFSGGELNWFWASFNGGDVSLQAAHFNGGLVDFTSPASWKRPPMVPWKDGEEPKVGVEPRDWPPELGLTTPNGRWGYPVGGGFSGTLWR